MTRRSRSYSTDPKPTHPLEKVIQAASADSFEEDFGVREDRWAQKIRRDLDARLAGLRRRLNPARPSQHRATRISAALRALDRPELVARLDALRQAPGIRVAHLELSGLTTEDLRLLVAELESTAQTQNLQK
jgi:hypothetical protein